MPKKRTSPEPPSNDERKNEGSDSVFQQADNAKRAKLTTLSDTTLQDLPMELIERILVKAVAMEVMGTTRKEKAVWKEKADPVIKRLTAVCSQWRHILTTNFFRNELHRTFDAEKTFRLEILHQFSLTAFETLRVMMLKDELFVLCKSLDYYTINVYDRNNMADVKDVIPLPGIELRDIAACSVSNCLYALNSKKHQLSVLRIRKTYDQKFNISPLISDMRRRNFTLTVAANGNLILSWQKISEQRGVISVYDPNGHFQYETWLSSDISKFYFRLLPKSNGNFVVVSCDYRLQTTLTEIDLNGSVLRQYQSPTFACQTVCYADVHERVVIADWLDRIELLDCKFNPMEFTRPQLDEDQSFIYCWNMHYNRERNELVTVENEVLTILRFTEE